MQVDEKKAEVSEVGLVYVRSVKVADLPEELRTQIGGETGGLDGGCIYALHRPDGERLALVREREAAFALARQNDLHAVTVH